MKFELSRIIRENNVVTIHPKEGPKVVIPIQGPPSEADRVFSELGAMFGLSTSSEPKPVGIPPLPEGYRYAGVIATPKAPQQSGWPVASYPAPGDPGFLGETPKDNSQDLCSHEGEAPQGLLDALYDPCTCPGCGIGVNPEPSGLCPICDTQLR